MTERWNKEFDKVDEFLRNQDFDEITYKFFGDDTYELTCKCDNSNVVIKRSNKE